MMIKKCFKMKRLSLNDMNIIYVIECKSKLKSQKAKVFLSRDFQNRIHKDVQTN